MNRWWDKQINRANVLAEQSGASQPLIKFYGLLLTSQKEIYESLRSEELWQPLVNIVKLTPWPNFVSLPVGKKKRRTHEE